MKNSQFWVMAKKNITGSRLSENSAYPAKNLPPISIIELTPDELIYIWPKDPLYATLCLVCKNMSLRSKDICQVNVRSGYPCNFQAVPEAILSQDFEDFLIDGEYHAECGYYYSLEDFKHQNGYTDEEFVCFKLGEFPSIRRARQALIEAVNALSDTI